MLLLQLTCEGGEVFLTCEGGEVLLLQLTCEGGEVLLLQLTCEGGEVSTGSDGVVRCSEYHEVDEVPYPDQRV